MRTTDGSPPHQAAGGWGASAHTNWGKTFSRDEGAGATSPQVTPSPSSSSSTKVEPSSPPFLYQYLRLSVPPLILKCPHRNFPPVPSLHLLWSSALSRFLQEVLPGPWSQRELPCSALSCRGASRPFAGRQLFHLSDAAGSPPCICHAL